MKLQLHYLFLLLSHYTVCTEQSVDTILATNEQLFKNHNQVNAIKHHGASIVPITYIDGQWYAVIGKETRGYWDDFCGKADTADSNSLYTAAREFYEEALLEETTKITLQTLFTTFINQEEHIKRIICYANSPLYADYFTTYIVEFHPDFIQTVLTQFETARKDPKLPGHKREKTVLGLVRLDLLFNALKNAQPKKPVQVPVTPFNGTGPQKTLYVTLRPFLVEKLQQYARHEQPTLQLNDEKIIIYDSVRTEKTSLFAQLYCQFVDTINTQIW